MLVVSRMTGGGGTDSFGAIMNNGEKPTPYDE